MNPEDIREFAERARQPVAELKRDFWARQQQVDASASLAAGWALHEHARAVSPGFPSDAYLADDLRHHVQLKALLERAAQAVPFRLAPR